MEGPFLSRGPDEKLGRALDVGDGRVSRGVDGLGEVEARVLRPRRLDDEVYILRIHFVASSEKEL